MTIQTVIMPLLWGFCGLLVVRCGPLDSQLPGGCSWGPLRVDLSTQSPPSKRHSLWLQTAFEPSSSSRDPASCTYSWTVYSQVCGASRGWGQLDTGPGAPVSFHRKGFQAQPRLRDKRTSVHPLVPSPSFLEQHSFMQFPPSLCSPRPSYTASFQMACMLDLFVCAAARRLSVVLHCSLPMNPPSTPSPGKTGPGDWKRAGAWKWGETGTLAGGLEKSQ